MQRSLIRLAAPLRTPLLAVLVAACSAARAPEPAPPAPATPASASTPSARADSVRPGAADAQFLQHMMAHRAQAVVMTALVPERAARNEIRLIAERIAISQRDEMAMMERMLRRRGAAVPDVDPRHAQHGGGDMAAHASMPGMLTAAELARLRDASGPAFDRLFLEYMIRHHEGALAMVAQYFATQGAGRDAEIFGFVSDIDADQRAEIRRMRTLLAPAPAGGTPRS
jgi:uncharacterized protein (DUF305 family)